MPSYKTRTEYIITITTGSLYVKDQICSYLEYNRQLKSSSGIYQTAEKIVAICPQCSTDLTAAYTSVGPIYICDFCKWNNKKDYPQCVKCNQEPAEHISTVGMCYSCDPAFAPVREVMYNLRHHARDD